MKTEYLTVNDLLAILEGIAPFGLAEQWDNVGLMVGNPDQQVTGIMVALDPTEEVLEEAQESGANAIVTHHPLIFHPLKAIYTDQPLGRFLQKALASDISVVGCHTNLDQAASGVNDALASNLNLLETSPLISGKDAQNSEGSSGDTGVGFGRLGRLAEPLSGEAFVKKLCDSLNLPVVRITGNLPQEISMVAVCGGSGSELAEQAFAKGAQVYITGEVKHSTARWAEATGFCIVDGGHFATENPVVETLAQNMQKKLTEREINISVFTSAKQKNPFVYHKAQDSF
jgi:dinuclear metal center YbgI/SA1388 family protein